MSKTRGSGNPASRATVPRNFRAPASSARSGASSIVLVGGLSLRPVTPAFFDRCRFLQQRSLIPCGCRSRGTLARYLSLPIAHCARFFPVCRDVKPRLGGAVEQWDTTRRGSDESELYHASLLASLLPVWRSCPLVATSVSAPCGSNPTPAESGCNQGVRDQLCRRSKRTHATIHRSCSTAAAHPCCFPRIGSGCL